jgi:hypothetical protein
MTCSTKHRGWGSGPEGWHPSISWYFVGLAVLAALSAAFWFAYRDGSQQIVNAFRSRAHQQVQLATRWWTRGSARLQPALTVAEAGGGEHERGRADLDGVPGITALGLAITVYHPTTNRLYRAGCRGYRGGPVARAHAQELSQLQPSVGPFRWCRVLGTNRGAGLADGDYDGYRRIIDYSQLIRNSSPGESRGTAHGGDRQRGCNQLS